MTAPDLYLLASEAPGILDGVVLPIEVRTHARFPVAPLNDADVDAEWVRCVIDGSRPPYTYARVPAGTYHAYYSGRAFLFYSGKCVGRLDLRLPEVRDRLVRWGMEHDRRPPNPVRMKSEYLWPWLRDSPSALLAEVKAVAATLRE